MAGPFGALWPRLFRDSGVVGCTAAMPHPIAVMWAQSLAGAVLAGFLYGRLLGVDYLHGRLLGVGPLGAGSLESAIS